MKKLFQHGCRLFAANFKTALICSRETENSSMTSSTVKPASKFSNTVATGIRVFLNTQAPLTLPGDAFNFWALRPIEGWQSVGLLLEPY